MAAKVHTLEEIVELAKTHSFYRDRLSGVREFRDIPLTNKAQLYEVVTAHVSESGAHGLYLSPTGGSIANQLLFFPTAIEENIFQRHVLSAYLNEAGLFADAVAINLFGSNMMYRSLEIFNFFCERANATTLPVSAACDDATVYALGKHFQANTIMGMPSRLMQFAQYLNKEFAPITRTPLPLEHIIFAGESLPAHKLNYLISTFSASKISAIFGSAEAGIWAYRPFSLQQEAYLYPLEMMHVEVIDPDEDGFGRLVLTNLIRARYPLLRYDCGDRGKISQTTHLGRRMGLLELAGRVQNSFQIGGNYFDISELKTLTEKWLDFQIELSYDQASHKDRLHLLIVADEPFATTDPASPELLEALEKILQSNSEFTISVDLVSMKELTRSRTSGKVIKIIDRR